MRACWHRILAGSLLAAGMAVLAAVPAAAKDTYPFYGPLDVRIVGAGGDLREFTALSAEDRTGAMALVDELNNALQRSGGPDQATATSLPHYEIVVSHLGLLAPTMPWARLPEASFSYYPGGDARTFLRVEFARSHTGRLEHWFEPAPDVTAMLQRHLAGLAPIGGDAGGQGPSTAIWGLAIGGGLLAIASLLLFEDRRRWLYLERRRSAGSKGT